LIHFTDYLNQLSRTRIVTYFSQSADNLKVHLRILRTVQGNPVAKNWSLEEDCFIDATSCVG